jgi:hypothetical protein
MIMTLKNSVLAECCSTLNFSAHTLSVEMTDDLAQTLILRQGFEFTQLYNQFLIIKYLWDSVSTEADINKYEQLLLNYNTQTLKKSASASIFSNLEKILSQLINEYTQARYELLYQEIPHTAIPLSNLHFSCQIPDDLITALAQKRLQRGSITKPSSLKLVRQEISEDINLNIKVTTIYRCNLLQITNNARKSHRAGLAAEIPFTSGSTLIVEKALFKKLKSLLLTTKLPHSRAQNLTFKENGALVHLYDNLNFSYKIWITKFKNKINPDFLDDAALKNHSFDINNLTCIVNHLNNASIRINNAHFLEFKAAIEHSSSYKKILQHCARIKPTKLIHTVLDDNIEVTSDGSFDFNALNTKSINDYLEYTLIISQLTKLLKYFNGAFFLRYVLDGRSRIYVSQWPINYQLNHFVRNIVELTEMNNNWLIYKDFFASSEYTQYKDIYNLWKIQTIDYTKIQKLLNAHNAEINLAEIATLKPTCPENLRRLLIAESLLRVLASLAPSSCISLQDRINYASDKLQDPAALNNLLAENTSFANNIFEKNDFSRIKKIKTLKKLFVGEALADTWWADASSNALQLIVLTRGTNNNLLLQLLNLIENTTEHKNIYSYLAHQLRGLDYKPLITNIDDNFLQIIDINLAKYIAMPAAYGKTLWSCKKTIKKNLANKNTRWLTLNNDTQDKLCTLWYTNTFKFLAELGLDLKDHILRCKTSYDATCPVYSHFKIPIFTRTIKVLNRSTILRKLKVKKQILRDLLRGLPDAKDLNSLTEAQLALRLAQELNQLTTETENKYNLQQAYKLVKTIQTQKKALLESNACTRRVNVIIRQATRIQFRLARLDNNSIDIQRSSTAIAPNITHAYDAAILLYTVEKLSNLRIPCMCIHDSIGCRLEHLPITIYMYKYNLISTVKEYYSQNTRYFPYSTTESYALANIRFPEEILNSTNLFY